MPHLEFGRLKKQNIPEALKLSIQAGWNQTEADWRRLLDLNPEGVFTMRLEGQLVATATLASYGRDLNWIGMVIVDETCRGQGVGKAVLKYVIEESFRSGISLIGLDATDLGKPLYQKYGFVSVCLIDRWSGMLQFPTVKVKAQEMSERHLEAVVALDRRVCGIDRGPLFQHLFAEPMVQGWIMTGATGIRSYAFLRPGRTHWHLGPLIAENKGDFSALLHAASAALAGEPVLMDAVRENTPSELLLERHMESTRHLTRMIYQAPRAVLTGKRIRLITGFEWG